VPEIRNLLEKLLLSRMKDHAFLWVAARQEPRPPKTIFIMQKHSKHWAFQQVQL